MSDTRDNEAIRQTEEFPVSRPRTAASGARTHRTCVGSHREHAEFSEYVPVPEPRVITEAEVDVLCEDRNSLRARNRRGLLLSPEVLKGGAR
jgi:hypothetical protein